MNSSLPPLPPGPANATSEALASLRRLEWQMKHQVTNLLGGEYRSAFRGKGMEFDQVVRYNYGDDVRDIDWKVTARSTEPYRKKFVEERELTVLLVFEDRLSLQFGSEGRTKRDAMMELICQVMLLAANNRDRIGIVHAQPGGYTLWKPVRGRAAIMQAAAQLLATPAPDLADTRPLKMPWRFVGQAAPKHSILVWCGDFAPQPEPHGWSIITGRYHAVGFKVDDPWERGLPPDKAFSVYDPVAQHLVVLNPRSKAHQEAHAAWVAKREARFGELFRDARDRLVVTPNDSMTDALARFFRAHMAMN
ncbi:DUF58 domain-containing protein [Synoicihabitans lomoniglobus]|uniref:DUF58 domain-containing protein n=1 Tax=Synoicihabitans lomoniglobus TaxID=2909285 RepID=A0AAF0I395_9BACT|nr:DUF58 domain-containing protein [Opitutaceae bacterium LMO-M01]WED65999.1 DUF58 domain-containing protein [Opitutaceae bacterium LMO-M01]